MTRASDVPRTRLLPIGWGRVPELRIQGGPKLRVKRSDAGFEVLPKRWIVERTFAWISRNRWLGRDFERYATFLGGSSVMCANQFQIRGRSYRFLSE
jgi:transposase